MGFELVLENGQVNREQTLVRAMATPYISDSMFFMDMMFMIDKLETSGWDNKDTEHKQSLIDDILDLSALRTKYEQQNNHKF